MIHLKPRIVFIPKTTKLVRMVAVFLQIRVIFVMDCVVRNHRKRNETVFLSFFSFFKRVHCCMLRCWEGRGTERAYNRPKQLLITEQISIIVAFNEFLNDSNRTKLVFFLCGAIYPYQMIAQDKEF